MCFIRLIYLPGLTTISLAFMWLLLLTVFTILSKDLTKKKQKQKFWLADRGMNMFTGEKKRCIILAHAGWH